MHQLSGNGMHLPNIGIVTLTVMAGVQLFPVDDPAPAALPQIKQVIQGSSLPRETPMQKLQPHIHVKSDHVCFDVAAWSVLELFSFEHFGGESKALASAEIYLASMSRVVRGLVRFDVCLQMCLSFELEPWCLLVFEPQ